MSATEESPVLFVSLVTAVLLAGLLWWGYTIVQAKGLDGLPDLVGIAILTYGVIGGLNGSFRPAPPEEATTPVDRPISRIMPEVLPPAAPISRVIGEAARKEDVLERAWKDITKGSSKAKVPRDRDGDDDWSNRLHF